MELAKRHILYVLNRSTVRKGDCWIVRNNQNYSCLKIEGKNYTVHRLSAYLYLGLDIDDSNIQVNHKPECTSAHCWNPDHLYIGTQSQNLKDQVIKGTHPNAIKTHCPKGHKYDQVKWNKGKIVGRRCSQCRVITG